MRDPLQQRIFHPTYLRLLCLHIRRAGVSIADALAETGMTWRQLLREKRLIAFAPVRSLILAAKRLTGQPDLGLQFGASVMPAAHGVTGTAIVTSRDVSQALEAVIRYAPLRGRAVKFEAAGQNRSTVVIREPFDFGDVRTFILEAHVGIIRRLLTDMTGEPLTGIEYRFPYPQPAWAPEYSRWLAGTVRFDAACTEVRVPEEDLRLPCLLADAPSRAAIALLAEHELVFLRSSGDLTALIKRRLSEQRGAYPSLQAMAEQLNMSARTLLRKLKQEGTSYQSLLDDARKHVAEWYLLRTREPIEAIADHLGYADASNFSRTFRRWFGKSPGKFRSARRGKRAAGFHFTGKSHHHRLGN
jgi:AraC-like DNA-binding protein